MTKIQNIATGEVKEVFQTKVTENGYLKSNKNKTFGKRFINAWAGILTEWTDENGEQVFELSPEWQVVAKGERKPRQEKPQPEEDTTSAVEEATENDAHDDEEPTPQPEPQDEPQPATQPQTLVTGGLNDALALAFAPVFQQVAEQIKRETRAEMAAEMAELRKVAEEKARRIEVVANGEIHEVSGVVCEDFEDILEDVNMGYFPYLHGAAGCGKSYTAEQVAAALGLDFYTQTTIQFAHDVKGYGDAAGRYVETPFFKAFKNGGLYFQDEYDRSCAEAAIVLNTALANGYYDFPVEGRVMAHPKFRFMAAGNTTMTGPDMEYVTGQVMDASSRDRVIYYEMHYDRRVELQIAGNDEELVDFLEDVRQAIKSQGISHVVSYRATKYMRDHKDKKQKALLRCTFKGLQADEIRIIYGALNNTGNAWAREMYKMF